MVCYNQKENFNNGRIQNNEGLNKFSCLDSLIWNILTYWLLVDSVNGLFIVAGINLPLSQIYKMLILVLILKRLLSQKSVLILFSILLFYLSWLFTYFAIMGTAFNESVLLLSKFITLVFLYCYFRFSVKNFQEKSIKKAKHVIFFSALIFFINILFGIMGFGIPSYGEGYEDLGVKGFFYAGNELGGVISVLAPLVMYILWFSYSGIKFCCLYFITVACCFVLGTKTGILVGVIAAVCIPFVLIPSKDRIKAGVILLVLLLASYYILSNADIMSIKSIERWAGFLENDGVQRLIFSGRDTFWESQKMSFFNSSFFEKFWGQGVLNKSIEQDHLDALLIFGIFGLFVISSFLIYLLIRSFIFRKSNSLSPIILLSNILAITISLIAGHIWFSAMANMYIALSNSLVNIRKKGYLFN